MRKLRRKIRIKGVVQGVGFRPFVWRLANQFGLFGWVLNDAEGVLIEVQGNESDLDDFAVQIYQQLPPLASISSFVSEDLPQPIECNGGFLILSSQSSDQNTATVPPDVSICPDCERELLDPENRRFRYPFINCTNCGPRFTIIMGLPYDRANSTMASFSMCEDCLEEYQCPSDRRFHAQPNACPKCGPKIWFEKVKQPDGREFGEAAIVEARDLVLSGGVVAVKGIGGFHLACNAFDQAAVVRLRRLKQRVDKPLAVMVADLETARQIAAIDPGDEGLLLSPQRPVVLMPKKSDSIIAASVAPGNPLIGLLLPYSPLHRLLVEPGDCWVMTSGNLSDEPIARDNEEAVVRLGSVCDGFLLHDRAIETVCDDSVVRSFRGGALPIRRSRGYCPLPVSLSQSVTIKADAPMDSLVELPCVLAVGGEVKTAVCLAHSDQAILGQHVGDMGNQETLLALERSVEHLLRLYEAKPVSIAGDLHPGYLSATWGREFGRARQIPFIAVQHHHAHAVALMTEHGMSRSADSIIACVFDGTGFGTDETIWGGEWLIVNPLSFTRFAHLEYTPLPGGDSAIDRPSKIALAQLFHFAIDWDERLPSVTDFSGSERKILHQQLQRKLNTVNTSSMGRLFDCIASLIGVRQRVHFEGQAAIELECLAASKPASPAPSASKVGLSVNADSLNYPVEWNKRGCWVLNYGPMLSAIVRDFQADIDPSEIAAKFHRTIAAATADICIRARDEFGINIVGLTGGVFQNVLLTELVRRILEGVGFEVLIHEVIPPNDGGIALGQAVIGRAMLRG